MSAIVATFVVFLMVSVIVVAVWPLSH